MRTFPVRLASSAWAEITLLFTRTLAPGRKLLPRRQDTRKWWVARHSIHPPGPSSSCAETRRQQEANPKKKKKKKLENNPEDSASIPIPLPDRVYPRLPHAADPPLSHMIPFHIGYLLGSYIAKLAAQSVIGSFVLRAAAVACIPNAVGCAAFAGDGWMWVLCELGWWWVGEQSVRGQFG
jgi:hypothetical protein